MSTHPLETKSCCDDFCDTLVVICDTRSLTECTSQLQTALVGVSHFRKVITPVHEQLFVSATVQKFRFLGPFAYPLFEGV